MFTLRRLILKPSCICTKSADWISCNEIEGDYAIALWDAGASKLVLVRDRIGVKPLYYYHQNGRFIFASEIKAILQHPAVVGGCRRRRALPLPDFSDDACAEHALSRHSKNSRRHMLAVSSATARWN